MNMQDNGAGTLAGLIADLEAFIEDALMHYGGYADAGYRVEEIVRTHKRAIYNVIEPVDPKLLTEHEKHLVGKHTVMGPDPEERPFPVSLKWGTKAECEAWIERQVNGDA